MGVREDLLAYISWMTASMETAEVYGIDWRQRDFKTRQSGKAGELCLAVERLTRAGVKSGCRPGSKGARKAKRKAKEYRREIRHLEAVLAESFSDYRPTVPQYINTPGADCDLRPRLRGIIRKDSGKAAYYVD